MKMRLLLGLGIAISGLTSCLLLWPAATVTAKTRVFGDAPRVYAALPAWENLVLVQEEEHKQDDSRPSSAPGAGRPSKTSEVSLPDGEGKDLTKRLCSTCHGTDVFARQRHKEDRWNQIIDNMTSKGLEASDDDLDKVAHYLATYLGPESPATEQPAPKSSTPKE